MLSLLSYVCLSLSNIDILVKDLYKLPNEVGWNLNYDVNDNSTTTDKTSQELVFTKEPVEFTKEFIKEPVEFTKEFIKASRQIYKLISMNPKVSTAQMADSMGLSTRQVLKYLKRLQDLGKIARVGGRKMGEWKIIDEEYEGFFDRI